MPIYLHFCAKLNFPLEHVFIQFAFYFFCVQIYRNIACSRFFFNNLAQFFVGSFCIIFFENSTVFYSTQFFFFAIFQGTKSIYQGGRGNPLTVVSCVYQFPLDNPPSDSQRTRERAFLPLAIFIYSRSYSYSTDKYKLFLGWRRDICLEQQLYPLWDYTPATISISQFCNINYNSSNLMRAISFHFYFIFNDLSRRAISPINNCNFYCSRFVCHYFCQITIKSCAMARCKVGGVKQGGGGCLSRKDHQRQIRCGSWR